ncbi:polysaccharide pyruvyl transferase family protein [Tetragenococcus halophilus]|nr:polysaccharide pyruvyl transferase family protein [Tetragenococcus halophilus]MCO8292505.1 polysaccharide pyruvyl transferase family protein [Tetragenococcus halophilus]
MIGYTGGGNIGNVYLDHEEPRRKVFSTFVNNKTISFPQSVNFEDTEQGQEELRKSQEAYNKNPNLTIVARETQSLNYFKKNFAADVIYTSDIVASLKPDPSEGKRDGVLFIMRQDSEKVINEKLLEQLSYKLNNVGDEVEQTDTVLPFKASDSNADTAPDLDEVRISERGWLIERKLEEIKASEAVVTDRLHGMIFCVLTKTPCLVFDNSYGKASASYYNWFEDLDYIKHTTENDPDKLAPMIEELKGYEHSNYHDFTHSYDELIDLIKK